MRVQLSLVGAKILTEFALLAQLVEHLTLNQGVEGSSPLRRTKFMIEDTEFVETLRQSRLTVPEIACGVAASIPTVMQWMRGVNLPSDQGERDPVIRFLKKKRKTGL